MSHFRDAMEAAAREDERAARAKVAGLLADFADTYGVAPRVMLLDAEDGGLELDVPVPADPDDRSDEEERALDDLRAAIEPHGWALREGVWYGAVGVALVEVAS